MPDFADGLRAAFISSIIGFIVSTFLHSIVENDPSMGTWVLLFELISILAIIEMLGNMNFWGIGYSMGFFLGIFMAGGSLMASLESDFILLFLLFAIGQKIFRKLK